MDVATASEWHIHRNINKYNLQHQIHMDDTVAAREHDGIKGRYEEGEVPINSLLINHDDKVVSIHRRESQFHHSGLPRQSRCNIVMCEVSRCNK